MPGWFLLLAFWFHMLVTVAWLGTLGTSSFWLFPNLKRTLSTSEYQAWISPAIRRIISISWVGIGLLTVSGLFQMADNSNYEGFLNVGNRWAAAILVKHLVFLVMVILTALLTWKTFPELERQVLLEKVGKAAGMEKIVTSIERLVSINFWLGVLTLALTALARIS